MNGDLLFWTMMATMFTAAGVAEYAHRKIDAGRRMQISRLVSMVAMNGGIQ
jgi:hypothetical protein